jgi:integrase
VSVRKREWVTSLGEERQAWVVDYADAGGVRRLKTFARKKEADAWEDATKVAVRDGTHVAASASVTVAEAGRLWIKTAEAAELERATIEQYLQHLRLHIVGDGASKEDQQRHRGLFIGHLKLSEVNPPTIRAYEDRLREAGRSKTLTRYVVRSLGTLFADAQERGLIGRNPVRELRVRRRRRRKGQQDRPNGKPQVGIDIPTPGEVRQVLAAASGRWRPLLLVATFAGLRSSELRGLRWSDVDLGLGEIHVRQRADRYNQIGSPKSDAGERTIPVGAGVVRELREWKLKCPKGELGLVFPNGSGKVESHPNIIQRGLIPIMIAAGVTKDGEAKYTGLHALRHFFASLCINREKDGGLGLTPKIVQERMGHATLALTLDRYSHLFPRGDDSAELAAAESRLLG